MKIEKSKLIIVGLIVVVASCLAWFSLSGLAKGDNGAKPATASAKGQGGGTPSKKSSLTKGLDKIKGPVKSAAPKRMTAAPTERDEEEKKFVDSFEMMFGHLKPAEKAIAIKVQEAMDKGDRSAAFSAALKAMEFPSADLRMHAIDAFAWHGGSQTLPHLTKMLTDPATEVSEAALNAVQHVLMGVDDAAAKFKAASMYLDVCKDNADARTVFAGIMSASSGDLLETAESRKEVIDTVLKFIYGGGDCGEEAKALYHNITGVEWTNQGEAYKWVKNPEASSDPGT